MSNERFEKIEGGGNNLPPGVKDALSRIDRFNALEIGLPADRRAPQSPAPAAAPAADPKKVACVHCGQLNEAGRETCWACYRFVALKAADSKPAGPDEITLVIDGATYRSGQKDLPDDIAELMSRIRRRGYTPELLSEWRTWRATRRSQPLEERRAVRRDDQQTRGEDEANGIKVFRGQRVSVLRLDGKVYTSDDPDLTPELKELFAYIDQHGVTPELMEHLRSMGKVKLRPETTAYPSDGDLDFWKQVESSPRDLERRRAELELEVANRRYRDARYRMTVSAAGIALTILYILGSIFLR